jgi:predicted GIY-YIG superfamily endonuclease
MNLLFCLNYQKGSKEKKLNEPKYIKQRLKMETNIYVLLLQEGKYYVGKSQNIKKRIQEHSSGLGSEWTKLYKPIKVIEIIKNVSPFEEDKKTKEYMAKYGIENVRGGTYTSIEFEEGVEEFIQKEIWSATDKCTLCGRSGHFVKDCIATSDIFGNKIEFEYVYETSDEDSDSSEYSDDSGYIYKKDVRCFKCGKIGHYSSTCYSR